MRITTLSTLCAILLVGSQARAMPVDLHCERNQQVTLGGDLGRDGAIEMKWKGMLYKMMRVGTSTGAHRFEDPVSGLILISIPGKAMLLDGKRGQPVANECRARIGGRPVR
jgi:hypothetical protein